MLLSMYASYLWANHSKKTYVLMMIAFVPLVSFLSAYIPMDNYYFLFLIFPFHPLVYASFLSFPFYAFIDEIYIRGHPAGWVNFHSIRFLTIDLSFAESSGWGIVYLIQHNLWEQILSTFYFFLFVNILGALLGYLIAKKYRIQFFRDKWDTVSCVLVAIACIVGGILLGSVARVGVTLFGVGIFLLNIILFKTLVLPLIRGFAQTLREIIKG